MVKSVGNIMVTEESDGRLINVVDFPADLQPDKSLCAKVTLGAINSVTVITVPTWVRYCMITATIPVGILNGNAAPDTLASLTSLSLDAAMVFGAGQFFWDGPFSVRQLDPDITTLNVRSLTGSEVLYVNLF